MNKQALDFFGLVTEEGKIWDDSDFKDSNEIMPVLLGSSYRNVYHIGDETTINHYQKTLTIRVIGFLKKNSKIYFNSNAEFYLDNYMVLPYRDYEEPAAQGDELFQKASYLAMINGYAATENIPSKVQKLMQRIEAIAQKSSIEYSFIGMNPHYNKYRGLMTVLQEDKMLVEFIFISTSILNLIIISIILLLQQKRRMSSLAIHYINGATKLGLIKMQWLEISSVLLAAYLTNFIILENILKIGDYLTQFYMLLLCMAMSIILCVLPACKLLFNPITDYIHIEDEGGR
ncbi:hypothetical protein SAMN04487970_10831 [Paenibacillus tianmuensis]|uniref:FtsX-like permease family protein n=1 Tax=Paenibacillus tianmuensis TaxID=624147 RepID=A0A1G4TZM9_9BACL|nr:hypothetical protein [Paenibacillus tianmuensis]SCW86788.1 hypothetical protein SAMN04487970_10831 [Paenibacillus tianmuensis]